MEQNGIGPDYGMVEFTLIKNENRKRKNITGFKNGKLVTLSEKGALRKKRNGTDTMTSVDTMYNYKDIISVNIHRP